MVSGASPSRSAPSESSSGFSSSSSGVSRTRMGKYELGRTLGEGTFAKVKFARNIVNGENVAIKIIDKEKVLRNKMIAHIKRDISTMKLIKHPNVIRIVTADPPASDRGYRKGSCAQGNGNGGVSNKLLSEVGLDQPARMTLYTTLCGN
ncbi:hypothetical protein F2Q69_00008452 [Brassica cretica]|uniref:Protein kinase domain-containing protein n=1 Tax=Brassica cretica TaxID=69181 RepID=A0A8S9PD20_BRACR|nr:hypothetical protein F2Q69_00008452 [Brassica cretica]